MNWFLLLLLTMAAAAVGAFIGYKLHLPAGCMVGAMVVVIALNLATGLVYFPVELRTVVQMFSGSVIGTGIRKKDVHDLKGMAIPVVLLLGCMVVLNVIFGTAIHYASGLDPATAMFASAPGGMTDMAIIAGDLGANPSYVVILQLSRLIMTLALLPPIFAKIINKRKAKAAAAAGVPGGRELMVEMEAATLDGAMDQMDPEPAEENKDIPMAEKNDPAVRKKLVLRFIFTVLVAVAGGTIGYVLGIPAGAMIGAMVASAAVNIATEKCYVPTNMRRFTQCFAGAYIGTTMTQEYVMKIPQLIVPMLIMMAGVFIWCFLISAIIHKITKLEFTTCMLACAPGGVQDMCLLADELGMDTPKIAVMQTARVVGTLAIFPTLLKFVTSWFI